MYCLNAGPAAMLWKEVNALTEHREGKCGERGAGTGPRLGQLDSETEDGME